MQTTTNGCKQNRPTILLRRLGSGYQYQTDDNRQFVMVNSRRASARASSALHYYSNLLIDVLLISLSTTVGAAATISPPQNRRARHQRCVALFDLNSPLKFSSHSNLLPPPAHPPSCCRQHKNILQIWRAEFKEAKNRKRFSTAAVPHSGMSVTDAGRPGRDTMKDMNFN